MYASPPRIPRVDTRSFDVSIKSCDTSPVSLYVSYKSSDQNITPVKMQEYVSSVCSNLKQNWNPPKSGRNSQAIVIITIGEDGGLYEYHFAQSSKDEASSGVSSITT